MHILEKESIMSLVGSNLKKGKKTHPISHFQYQNG